MTKEQIDKMLLENQLSKSEKELSIEILISLNKANDLARSNNIYLSKIQANLSFFFWFVLIFVIPMVAFKLWNS